MQSFKITKEELETFARKLYTEACCGYLDLCEAVTDKMVTDFLDGRQPVTPTLLAGFPPSNSISPNVMVSYSASSAVDVSFTTGPAFTGGVTGPPFVTPPAFTSGIAITGDDLGITNSGYQRSSDDFGIVGDPAYQRPNNPYPASLETAGYRPTQAERDVMYGRTTPSLLDAVIFTPEITTDNSVVVTESSPVIREEVFVRTENFAGNESERF